MILSAAKLIRSFEIHAEQSLPDVLERATA